LLEALSMHSDEITELLLEEMDVPRELVVRVLRRAAIHEGFVPVLLGAALRNRGIPALLNAIVAYLPSPADLGAVSGCCPATGDAVSHPASPEAPLGAMVFKTVHFSTGDLSFVRLYSGAIESGSAVYNPRLGRHERVGRIFLMHAGSREAIERASAGQIIACMGLKKSTTGDSLCQKSAPILYGTATFAEPVISVAVEPRSAKDRDRLGEVLGIIAREDPTFRACTDPETGQTLISGMGELHLEVIAHRLRDEFGLELLTGKPRVAYRQTLRAPARIESRHIKQTGGSGQYAVAHVDFEPIEGEAIDFVDKIKGGKIRAEFLVSLEKGIRDYCQSGGRRGARIQGVRATCFDGKMHDVDSSQIAFYTCGVQAMRQAEERAGLRLLEPIMRVVVTAVEEHTGAVVGDISSRRGTVTSIDDEGRDKRVSARIPLSELAAYATSLRNITSGRGSYTMEPAGYEEVPPQILEKAEL
ncbi:MAG: elongation factor G, partial [Planctomycetes bacterium]|nr:elongation factor G [Planctomycetota bacterium]